MRARLKAYRNGNWRTFEGVKQAFFEASLQLAKLRGRIVNPSLVKAVKTIISKLIQTSLVVILQLGGSVPPARAQALPCQWGVQMGPKR